jgi:hypothetical protein
VRKGKKNTPWSGRVATFRELEFDLGTALAGKAKEVEIGGADCLWKEICVFNPLTLERNVRPQSNRPAGYIRKSRFAPCHDIERKNRRQHLQQLLSDQGDSAPTILLRRELCCPGDAWIVSEKELSKGEVDTAVVGN